MNDMATELSDPRPTQTVDLTGLPDPVAERLRDLVRALKERHSGVVAVPQFISRPRPSFREFEQILDEFSAGRPGKILPPDFSRADIYDDHD